MNQQYVLGCGLPETRFFIAACQHSQFVGERVRTRAEQDVNDVRDKWTDDSEIELNEFGCYGIQSEGGSFHSKLLDVF